MGTPDRLPADPDDGEAAVPVRAADRGRLLVPLTTGRTPASVTTSPVRDGGRCVTGTAGAKRRNRGQRFDAPAAVVASGSPRRLGVRTAASPPGAALPAATYRL